MAQRKRIGICYNYSEGWIAGTYYIENLIHALDTLPDVEKPHLVVLTNHHWNYVLAKKKITYPYLSFRLGSGESNRFFQFVNKVSGRLFNKKIFRQRIKGLDAIFPYYKCVQQSLADRKIYWIADFQEHFGQEFFDPEMIAARKRSQFEIQASDEYLVLSSQDSLGHFRSIYPDHRVRVKVLPFAVTHPGLDHLKIQSLLEKFNLPDRYFICPNQFWKHKNQSVILRAVNELKTEGMKVIVAFTGNTEDQRNPDYFPELAKYIEKHHLQQHIRFLGFIDRAEQLLLMRNSMAIIQPSLFEGWSTVVEDAKALNKQLIVSGIAVHHEQLLNSNARFFDPINFSELSVQMKEIENQKEVPPLYNDYQYPLNVQAFGNQFLQIAT